MNNRGNSNLGDEIRNIVQDAVSNGDFNRLNRDIGNVVNGALDEVKKSIGRGRDGQQNNKQNNVNWKVSGDPNSQNGNANSGETDRNRQRNQYDSQYRKAQDAYNQNYNNNSRNYNKRNYNTGNYNTGNSNTGYNNSGYRNTTNYNTNQPTTRPAKYTVPVGQVAGTLFTVFGALGSTAFGIAAGVLALIGYVIGNSVLFPIISLGLLPCFLVCLGLSINGGRIRKRLKRYQRYITQMRGRTYCLIKDFSAATGRNEKYTIKDVQKMIAIGMFPEGHLDDKKTCFMLNGESYQQYLNLQENMRTKTMEEAVNAKEQSMGQGQAKGNTKDNLDPVMRKAIEEGRQFVQKIRNANNAIPGEEISRKLDRLETVTGKIYDYVETRPEKFPEIKKFTEYFLPTTLKLLDAYKDLDAQPVAGENILTAKKEIEDTMDTINLAFENLLDGLFEDAAMDISTDISVLQTMFAQEGLTEKNIRK
ncbi:MAG: 5-bromo-4-chloroindolyl phosphate hydrolysis protein [Herbinix sp.]|jgi:5-bromo-4-chloroindolyl phosphate hydrolysis protein|nr:5-bromo-4-chloroindolyl phosphate hydrolysis protein [Herbinix sp.]